MKRRDPLEPFKSTYSEEDKMARLAVFAKQEGLVIQSSQPALSIGLIGVMPCLSEEEEPVWCVYGDLPACIFNRELSPTPFDACGIYTWFLRQVVLALGDGLDRGDLPLLRH